MSIGAAGNARASLINVGRHVHISFPTRCLDGVDADPLGVPALDSRMAWPKPMAVLLIILLITIGLAVRAALYGRRWNVADSTRSEDSSQEESPWLIDTFARSFVVVLLSLLGLLALGVMYGNVLGAAHQSP
jgi:hypothetical protein